MEEQTNRLIQKAWGTSSSSCIQALSLTTADKYQNLPDSQRLIIGIAGIPGSGKTTLAAKVVKALNARHYETQPQSTRPIAAFVPMDGYHLSRSQLSELPDPTTAHARRGAAFTFDPSSFHMLVRKLSEPLTPTTATIHAPSFSHETKDPIADDIPIAPTIRIVVIEGLYVALNEGEWVMARECMDEVWFVQVEESVARRRLVKRHVLAGIAKDEEEAGRRADENDLVNGREIVAKMGRVDEVVRSWEDGGWKED